MADKALVLAAPLLAVAVLWWLVNRTDRIIARLFPHLEWEKDLGWLNIRAERRAKTALRLLGAVIYLALAGTLIGITWETRQIVDALMAGTDWTSSSYVMIRMGEVVVYLGAWLIILGSWLLPKVRAEREEKELQRYRAQVTEEERERERRKRRRPATLVTPQKKPRTNLPFETEAADHRRRFPGE
jgi:uncharacterized membrane protein YciS (DUF1049 family)